MHAYAATLLNCTPAQMRAARLPISVAAAAEDCAAQGAGDWNILVRPGLLDPLVNASLVQEVFAARHQSEVGNGMQAPKQ